MEHVFVSVLGERGVLDPAFVPSRWDPTEMRSSIDWPGFFDYLVPCLLQFIVAPYYIWRDGFYAWYIGRFATTFWPGLAFVSIVTAAPVCAIHDFFPVEFWTLVALHAYTSVAIAISYSLLGTTQRAHFLSFFKAKSLSKRSTSAEHPIDVAERLTGHRLADHKFRILTPILLRTVCEDDGFLRMLEETSQVAGEAEAGKRDPAVSPASSATPTASAVLALSPTASMRVQRFKSVASAAMVLSAARGLLAPQALAAAGKGGAPRIPTRLLSRAARAHLGGGGASVTPFLRVLLQAFLEHRGDVDAGAFEEPSESVSERSPDTRKPPAGADDRSVNGASAPAPGNGGARETVARPSPVVSFTDVEHVSATTLPGPQPAASPPSPLEDSPARATLGGPADADPRFADAGTVPSTRLARVAPSPPDAPALARGSTRRGSDVDDADELESDDELLPGGELGLPLSSKVFQSPEVFRWRVSARVLCEEIVSRASSGAAVSERDLTVAKWLALLATLIPAVGFLASPESGAPEVDVPLEVRIGVFVVCIFGTFQLAFVNMRFALRMARRSRFKGIVVRNLLALLDYGPALVARLPFIDTRVLENTVAWAAQLDVVLHYQKYNSPISEVPLNALLGQTLVLVAGLIVFLLIFVTGLIRIQVATLVTIAFYGSVSALALLISVGLEADTNATFTTLIQTVARRHGQLAEHLTRLRFAAWQQRTLLHTNESRHGAAAGSSTRDSSHGSLNGVFDRVSAASLLPGATAPHTAPRRAARASHARHSTTGLAPTSSMLSVSQHVQAAADPSGTAAAAIDAVAVAIEEAQGILFAKLTELQTGSHFSRLLGIVIDYNVVRSLVAAVGGTILSLISTLVSADAPMLL